MGRRFEVAAVTGAASGLGRELALELARRGASVALGDLNEVGLAETRALVEGLGGRAVTQRVDVREPAEIEALWAVAEGLGAVDLWVNNAGVAVAGEVGEVSLEDWAWQLDINLRGVVHGCHVAVPRLRARGRGAVLNVASAAGLVSTPRMAPYNMSKAAVVALTETMYGELRGSGVTTTVLCPTFFQTNLLDTARGSAQGRKLAAAMMRNARITARDVAVTALDATERGSLYCVPMADGRLMWRLRRLHPGLFYRLFGTIAARLPR